MSITAFFAVCILSIDFMIYFFFKLVYAEKRRAKPRRLPPEYYDDEFSACRRSESSPAQLVPARKKRLPRGMNVLSVPTPKVKLPGSMERKQQRDDAASPTNLAELLAYRRIVSLFAHASPDRKAS